MTFSQNKFYLNLKLLRGYRFRMKQRGYMSNNITTEYVFEKEVFSNYDTEIVKPPFFQMVRQCIESNCVE